MKDTRIRSPYGAKSGTCADCGKVVWRGRGSLPPGLARCRACRTTAASLRRSAPVMKQCEVCARDFEYVRLSRGGSETARTCGSTCAGRLAALHQGKSPVLDPEMRKARSRARNHRRRAVGREGDVTPEYEYLLRTKAKRCPMPDCNVRLIDEPYQPTSKELDHIVPLNVGGTHTIGNVRIICRLCNLRRPDDGSDYTGPVTLWAEVA